MKSFRFYFILLALMLLLTAGMESLAAAPRQQTNLLANPSFEDPYNGGTAASWAPWHRDQGPKPDECSASYAFRPQWSREGNSAIVNNGSISQHVGNQFDTWHGGVMQTVGVTSGSTYRFTFWATGRTTNEQYPAASDGSVNMQVRAGIDPNGSGLWNDADVVWGSAGSPHMGGGSGNWQQFSVEATATGNQVTVFASANLAGAGQCRAHLDVWFDNAALVEAGPPPTNTPPPQPTSPPAPAATNTPVPPTATVTPDVPPTFTPVPSPTATFTPPPPQGGTLCVNAFSDDNGNGQREAAEGSMAGVTFTVATDGVAVGQAVSSGPDPVCFEELEPGNYQVAQTVPATLEMTTGANTTITIAEGERKLVAFGSRVRSETAAVSDETVASETVETDDSQVVTVEDAEAEEDPAARSWLAVLGLGAIFVAIILLGLLIFLLLRQRA